VSVSFLIPSAGTPTFSTELKVQLLVSLDGVSSVFFMIIDQNNAPVGGGAATPVSSDTFHLVNMSGFGLNNQKYTVAAVATVVSSGAVIDSGANALAATYVPPAHSPAQG
jgi:hypothetical protein